MKNQFLNVNKLKHKMEVYVMKRSNGADETSMKMGEHKIIEVICRNIEHMPNMAAPFGDDVSALYLGDNKVAVLKTDMLVGKTDVPRGMDLMQAARKAVVMNVSDFASKGIQPMAALVALGLPEGYSEKDITDIAKGLNSGAREYGAFIVGGDTNESSDLVISVMLYGIADKSSLILRKGAKPGDILAVTGFFGKSAAGLRILMDGLKAPKGADKLIDAVLKPKARLAEGKALSNSDAVSAAIDSSDGLAWSLNELSRFNDVGFLLDNIPTADETREFAEFNKLDPVELTLYGGEEYELAVTVKPDKWDIAKEAVEAAGGQLIKIGKVLSEKENSWSSDGKKKLIEPRGWEHFKTHL